MIKTKMLVAIGNVELKNAITTLFNSDENFTVVATAGDGEEALAKFNSHNPDMVMLDLIMSKIDGFETLRRIKEKSPNTKVIAISALTDDKYVQDAVNLGADYYVVKPLNFESLKLTAERLASVNTIQRQESIEQAGFKQKAKEVMMKNRMRTIDERLSNIFITVGIPAHIKGYQFLREAVKMTIDCPDIINSITKRLYPDVAQKFDTSSSKVERAIRHAIEVAWNRGKIENINTLFGIRIYGSHEKPTNGEFIALVADKMLIEGA